MKAQNLIDKIFGRLTVLACDGHRLKERMWKCLCECGQITRVATRDLNSGNSTSCGCFNREQTALSNSTTHPSRKHGMKGTSTYKSWTSMKQRCLYKGAISYPRYGGRGIKICERWLNFINFFADMGERPPGTYIDRINNDGNYEPGNCRWVTQAENSNNRTSNVFVEFLGHTKTISQWAKIYNLNPNTLQFRIKQGWPLEDAFNRKADSAQRLSKKSNK